MVHSVTAKIEGSSHWAIPMLRQEKNYFLGRIRWKHQAFCSWLKVSLTSCDVSSKRNQQNGWKVLLQTSSPQNSKKQCLFSVKPNSSRFYGNLPKSRSKTVRFHPKFQCWASLRESQAAGWWHVPLNPECCLLKWPHSMVTDRISKYDINQLYYYGRCFVAMSCETNRGCK